MHSRSAWTALGEGSTDGLTAIGLDSEQRERYEDYHGAWGGRSDESEEGVQRGKLVGYCSDCDIQGPQAIEDPNVTAERRKMFQMAMESLQSRSLTDPNVVHPTSPPVRHALRSP